MGGFFQSIKAKILLALVFPIVLMLIALAVSLSGMQSVSKRFVDYLDHDQAKVIAIQKMYSEGMLSALASRTKIMNPALPTPRKVSDKAAKDVDSALSKMLELSAGDKTEMELLKQLEQFWKVNKSAKSEIFNKVAQDDIDGAMQVMIKKEQPSWKKIRGLLKKLMANANERAMATRLEVIGQSESTVITGVILGTGATVLGLVLGLLISGKMIKSLYNTAVALDEIAEGDGDLTRRLDVKGNDEVARLAKAFDRFVEKIHHIIVNARDVSSGLEQAAKEVNSLSRKSSSDIESEKVQLEQVATAMTEMSATVQEVARNAEEAAVAARQANTDTKSGIEIVNQTITVIGEISQEVDHANDSILRLEVESKKIGGVLDVIQGIAEQTNLLALNAAIEAARAGEQGRGFAVVADEVRTLAGRTQQSTQEIEAMIDRLQTGAKEAVTTMKASKGKTGEGVKVASKTGDSIKTIREGIQIITDMNTHIATAAEQQSQVAEEINHTMVSISDTADSTADVAIQTAKSANGLVDLSVRLHSLISRFKV